MVLEKKSAWKGDNEIALSISFWQSFALSRKNQFWWCREFKKPQLIWLRHSLRCRFQNLIYILVFHILMLILCRRCFWEILPCAFCYGTQNFAQCYQLAEIKWRKTCLVKPLNFTAKNFFRKFLLLRRISYLSVTWSWNSSEIWIINDTEINKTRNK